MMNGAFFSYAGFLFFASWSVALGSLTLAAFGRDLLVSNGDLPSGSSVAPSGAANEHRNLRGGVFDE